MPEKKNKEQENLEELKKELKEEIRKEVLEELKEETKKQEKKETNESSFEEKAKETFEKIMDTEDNTKDHDAKDIETNKGLAMISYLGPLALIPFLVSKESKYAQYHAKQGLDLFVIEIIIGIFSYFISSIVMVPQMCHLTEDISYECGFMTPWFINLPLKLLEVFTLALAIIGFVFAYQGKAKELPIIGKIKIIK